MAQSAGFLQLSSFLGGLTAAVLSLFVGRRLLREASEESRSAPPSTWERFLPLRGKWLRYFWALLMTLALGLFGFALFTVLFFGLIAVAEAFLR
jgi:hypothetical protein